MFLSRLTLPNHDLVDIYILRTCVCVCLQIETPATTKSFTFNVTFEPEASQEEVFEHCGVKKLVEMALAG